MTSEITLNVLDDSDDNIMNDDNIIVGDDSYVQLSDDPIEALLRGIAAEFNY